MAILRPSPYQRVQVTTGGSLVPPFFPLSLPGLEEYYDSRSLAFVHGATVTTWADLSGHSPVRDMIDSGLPGGMVGPTMNASSGLTPKGRATVAFNGTNSGLVTGSINPFPAATLGHSFHAYGNWKHTSAPPAAFAGAILWLTSIFNTVPKELILQSVGTFLTGWRDSGGFHLPTAQPSGFHLISWTFDPASGLGSLYFDAVLQAQLAYTFAGAGADTTGFSDYINNNVPLNADLGHFEWYSRAHTAAQVAQFYLWSSIYFGF